LLLGQPTVDGDLSDGQYTILATASRDGFGLDNELGVIKYYANGSDIYLGISGKLNDNNNIVLFFNFSDYNGRPAGTALDPLGNYEGFQGVFNKVGGSGLDLAKMDMEVDFALAFNEGGGSSDFYVDAARYGTNDILNTQYVGTTGNQTGISTTLPPTGGRYLLATNRYRQWAIGSAAAVFALG